jgi:phosphate:Na+ symporter
MLQLGMRDASDYLNPASFPGSGLAGRLLLVVIGAAMTVVLQSSSAAVATTLTALHSGAIGLDQAAALVVGQNIGTTVTAALAAAGASVGARRTAAAHILFNLVTGAVAFLLIPVLLRLETSLWPGSGVPDPELLIAAFHTTFNLLGVVVLLPLAAPFARMIERIVPERGPAFTRHLDLSATSVPGIAPEVARRTVLEVAGALVSVLRRLMGSQPLTRADAEQLVRADDALEETRRFITLAGARDGGHGAAEYVAVLHAIDHLDRLIERLRAAPAARAASPEYATAAALASVELARWPTGAEDAANATALESVRTLSQEIAVMRRQQRLDNLHDAAAGRLDAGAVVRQLEAMRWLDSSLYHAWRMMHHLAGNAAAGDSTDAAATDTAR